MADERKIVGMFYGGEFEAAVAELNRKMELTPGYIPERADLRSLWYRWLGDECRARNPAQAQIWYDLALKQVNQVVRHGALAAAFWHRSILLMRLGRYAEALNGMSPVATNRPCSLSCAQTCSWSLGANREWRRVQWSTWRNVMAF